jgi:hypothetical protein
MNREWQAGLVPAQILIIIAPLESFSFLEES